MQVSAPYVIGTLDNYFPKETLLVSVFGFNCIDPSLISPTSRAEPRDLGASGQD
jgi:hypothetical protein